MKKSLLIALFSVSLFCNNSFAKNLGYECTATGSIVGQQILGQGIFRAWEDYNEDGIADAKVTYLFDKGCLRKIRETTEMNETDEEALKKDKEAYNKYFAILNSTLI